MQILKDYLDADLEQKLKMTTFADQLRRVILDGQVSAPVTARKVAHYLGLSTSTLNRRLRAEGIAFKQLVDEIHFEMAKRFLKETSLNVTQVAQTIGFANTASFTRAFSRWSGGISPKRFRVQRPHSSGLED